MAFEVHRPLTTTRIPFLLPPQQNRRRAYGQAMRRVLEMAVYPLKVAASNPLPRGFLPKTRGYKATGWLRPDEDAQLMKCLEVLHSHRLLYGLLIREGIRLSEAQNLVWDDLDLKRGVVTLDENKTGRPRHWPLNSGVTAALSLHQAVCDSSKGSDRVFVQVDPYAAAEQFRAALKTAGILRPELFRSSDTRTPIRLHDLRGSFVTIHLNAGKTEHWVRRRTGHASSEMIARYTRIVGTAEEDNLGELSPLDELLWPTAGVCHAEEPDTATELENPMDSTTYSSAPG